MAFKLLGLEVQNSQISSSIFNYFQIDKIKGDFAWFFQQMKKNWHLFANKQEKIQDYNRVCLNHRMNNFKATWNANAVF